ncbi:ATP-binding protein [Cohnella abietis]|uniref:ATPase-like ATP-binding protein n=1 Tax=Cohnella abietis TaxID=2507935 RepID=A0A3T1D3H4_9BACL|nr:ATP-binding protein [Cohnella abietis]BBI32663.1 ATPase-like ATP-binding protein [Cohnella abietis]
MKVFLPDQFNRDTMYSFIDEVLNEDALPKSTEFDFDFTRLNFIRPVGVTVLSNLIGRLQKHGSKVTITYRVPDRRKKFCPIAFLDDSMFFKHYLGSTLDDTASLRPTTRPLANVTYDRSYAYLEESMSWLAGKLSLTKESLGDIKTCLKEVFNNIKDHSSENIGNIFIQQYPSENTVMVAISDFGVGIPRAVQNSHAGVDDAMALQMAVKEGFTTKSTPRNRGAGLDFLLHNVVKNNKGCVYIHSNHGILRAIHQNDGAVITTKKTSGFYPGTLLEIEFRTDTIEYIEEEFAWDD